MDVLQQILGFPQFRFHFSVSNFSVYDLFCFAGARGKRARPVRLVTDGCHFF